MGMNTRQETIGTYQKFIINQVYSLHQKLTERVYATTTQFAYMYTCYDNTQLRVVSYPCHPPPPNPRKKSDHSLVLLCITGQYIDQHTEGIKGLATIILRLKFCDRCWNVNNNDSS